MTECTGQEVLFSIRKRKVTAVFDEGLVTSDAGVLLLRGLDERLGLARRFAEAFSDRRQEGKVRHDLEDLFKQRFFQIACGYEDANDADTLRRDPGFQVALGRVPGAASVLSSQPTLSRLEIPICRRDVMALSRVILELYLERLRRGGRKAWRRIVLDFDSTADPVHGAQQLAMFHGYYDQWQYLPLLVFDKQLAGGGGLAARQRSRQLGHDLGSAPDRREDLGRVPHGADLPASRRRLCLPRALRVLRRGRGLLRDRPDHQLEAGAQRTAVDQEGESSIPEDRREGQALRPVPPPRQLLGAVTPDRRQSRDSGEG